MNKRTKKGFTLVELVIVIAVIAILSAILIPTFGSIIKDANETKAKADLKAAITTYLAAHADDADFDADFNGLAFVQSTSGSAPSNLPDSDDDVYVYNSGEITVSSSGTVSAYGDGNNFLDIGNGWYAFRYTPTSTPVTSST